MYVTTRAPLTRSLLLSERQLEHLIRQVTRARHVPY